MSDTRIDFSAPATLRKWPSLNDQRVSALLGARTYMIIEGTLDECIRKFMLQPKSQRHLYEIHTVRSDLVSAVLSTEHVVELALEEFSRKIAAAIWPGLYLIRNSLFVLEWNKRFDFTFRWSNRPARDPNALGQSMGVKWRCL
jgi:hypothetical protein